MLMQGDLNKIYTEVNRVVEGVMKKVRVLEAEVAILKSEKPTKVKEKLDK